MPTLTRTKIAAAQRRRRRTAYHEAGHAVMAYLRGRQIELITIEPADDTRHDGRHVDGYVDFVPAPRPPSQAPSYGGQLSEMMECLAGRVAEDLATDLPLTPRRVSAAFSVASILGGGWAGDYFELLDLAAPLGYETEPVARPFLKQLFTTTRTVLDEHRRALDALAGRLLAEGSLSGEAVHQVIAAARPW